MENLMMYGRAPYDVVVVHGGPGARGEMAPVAQELSSQFGILEPLQSALTLDGQIKELGNVLENQGCPPYSLIGFSWGAWLSYLVTAKYPTLVKKLILVGSGPYEHRYTKYIQETRLNHLNKNERGEYQNIITKLNDPLAKGKSTDFARLGQLAAKTDRFDPIETVPSQSGDPAKNQSVTGHNPFHQVLKEVQEMRQEGRLLAFAEQIDCPVVALHGDYDPHPIAGVREPLSVKIRKFRTIELEHCGHKPWIEKQAKDNFYAILKSELFDD